MEINYNNIPEMMTDAGFWELIRDILFEDESVVNGVIAKLRISQPSDNGGRLRARLGTALWLILTAAATGIRPDKNFSIPPPIGNNDERGSLFVRELPYLFQLLDKGIGLAAIEKRWGIHIKIEKDHAKD